MCTGRSRWTRDSRTRRISAILVLVVWQIEASSDAAWLLLHSASPSLKSKGTMSMRYVAIILLLTLNIGGCNKATTSDSPARDRDNTGVNERDRDASTKTPIDQNENQSDIDLTADIRKRVVDTEMSVNAQNVKIITQDGKVTLRGPVKSADEKKQIEDLAKAVAGVDNVDSQLEVEQEP